VGSFFQRVAVSLASPPDFNPELNPTTDGITLHLEVDDDQAPASENSLTVLVDAEWERGRHQHGSLCALNSAVGPFRLLAEPGSLQFRGGL
jgi:hypothetical protein